MLPISVSQLTAADLRALHECATQKLGLPSPFTEQDLKRAYHRAALQAHPDHGGDAEAFDALQRVVGYLKLLTGQDVPGLLAAREREHERLRAQAMMHALRLHDAPLHAQLSAPAPPSPAELVGPPAECFPLMNNGDGDNRFEGGDGWSGWSPLEGTGDGRGAPEGAGGNGAVYLSNDLAHGFFGDGGVPTQRDGDGP